MPLDGGQTPAEARAERKGIERRKSAKYIAFVQGCFAIALFAGMAQFHHKWLPASELMQPRHYHPPFTTPAFVELGLPRGHFAYILSDSHSQMFQNATARMDNLVDCDSPDTPRFHPPCYPGSHSLVSHIWIFTLLCPVLPVLVAMLHICFEHRYDKADAKKRIRGMVDNKEGKRGLRFCVYLFAVIFLQVWTIAKRRFEGPRPPFDPSDTICCFFACGAIAMREVAHIVHSEAPGKCVIVTLVAILTAAQLYYVYWTAMYFHLPAEVFAGGAIGVVLSFSFVYFTTLDCAMDSIFVSAASTYHLADGTHVAPLLA